MSIAARNVQRAGCSLRTEQIGHSRGWRWETGGREHTDVLVASRQHSIFLKSDGTVWAAGNGDHGRLGDGSPGVQRPTAVHVSALGSDNMAVSAGEQHSLYLKANGRAWSVGRSNAGQLGVDSLSTKMNQNRDTPEEISSLTTAGANILGITAGNFHSAFLEAGGTVYVCGEGNFGRLGV